MPSTHFLPCDALRPYLDRFWVWQPDQAGAPLPWMLPGTGAEIMFFVDRPTRRDGVVEFGGMEAFLICMRTQPFRPQVDTRTRYLVSVRVRSGGIRHFCPLPLEELFDRPIPIEAIWGDSARRLMDSLVRAEGVPRFLALLEEWLLARLSRHARINAAVEAAIWHLYYEHHLTRIDDLATQLGTSRRQLERVFRQHLGMSPKTFQRTARFHLTVRDLMLKENESALDTALLHGYYDQSHFIHDFEAFVGQRPQDYLRQTDRKAHFYSRPLLTPDTVPLPR